MLQNMLLIFWMFGCLVAASDDVTTDLDTMITLLSSENKIGMQTYRFALEFETKLLI